MNKVSAKMLEALTDDLVQLTSARDQYETDYELEKARLMMSAEISSLGNQTMRDAELLLTLEKKGMYRQMMDLKSKARLSWYRWAAIKSLIDGDVGKEI